MKHTREEIIAALRVIKDECAACKDNCAPCPFYLVGNKCAFEVLHPEYWQFSSEQTVWRAFE